MEAYEIMVSIYRVRGRNSLAQLGFNFLRVREDLTLKREEVCDLWNLDTLVIGSRC